MTMTMMMNHPKRMYRRRRRRRPSSWSSSSSSSSSSAAAAAAGVVVGTVHRFFYYWHWWHPLLWLWMLLVLQVLSFQSSFFVVVSSSSSSSTTLSSSSSSSSLMNTTTTTTTTMTATTTTTSQPSQQKKEKKYCGVATRHFSDDSTNNNNLAMTAATTFCEQTNFDFFWWNWDTDPHLDYIDDNNDNNDNNNDNSTDTDATMEMTSSTLKECLQNKFIPMIYGVNNNKRNEELATNAGRHKYHAIMGYNEPDLYAPGAASGTWKSNFHCGKSKIAIDWQSFVMSFLNHNPNGIIISPAVTSDTGSSSSSSSIFLDDDNTTTTNNTNSSSICNDAQQVPTNYQQECEDWLQCFKNNVIQYNCGTTDCWNIISIIQFHSYFYTSQEFITKIQIYENVWYNDLNGLHNLTMKRLWITEFAQVGITDPNNEYQNGNDVDEGNDDDDNNNDGTGTTFANSRSEDDERKSSSSSPPPSASSDDDDEEEEEDKEKGKQEDETTTFTDFIHNTILGLRDYNSNNNREDDDEDDTSTGDNDNNNDRNSSNDGDDETDDGNDDDSEREMTYDRQETFIEFINATIAYMQQSPYVSGWSWFSEPSFQSFYIDGRQPTSPNWSSNLFDPHTGQLTKLGQVYLDACNTNFTSDMIVDDENVTNTTNVPSLAPTDNDEKDEYEYGHGNVTIDISNNTDNDESGTGVVVDDENATLNDEYDGTTDSIDNAVKETPSPTSSPSFIVTVEKQSTMSSSVWWQRGTSMRWLVILVLLAVGVIYYSLKKKIDCCPMKPLCPSRRRDDYETIP